jgi:hypothetical protein
MVSSVDVEGTPKENQMSNGSTYLGLMSGSVMEKVQSSYPSRRGFQDEHVVTTPLIEVRSYNFLLHHYHVYPT